MSDQPDQPSWPTDGSPPEAAPPGPPPGPPGGAPPAPPSYGQPAPAYGQQQPLAAGGRRLSSVPRLIVAALLDSFLMIVTLGIGWLVWGAITAAEGQTPAKKLMGMQVVGAEDGRPLGWAHYVLLRGLVGGFLMQLAAVFTLGVILFMPLWDKLNQSVAAKVSSSVVVDV